MPKNQIKGRPKNKLKRDMKKQEKIKYYPLMIGDGGKIIAWLDSKGNWHCKKGKKKRVVEILTSSKNFKYLKRQNAQKPNKRENRLS